MRIGLKHIAPRRAYSIRRADDHDTVRSVGLDSVHCLEVELNNIFSRR